MLKGLFDKEGMVRATIETCLEDVAQKMECKPTELFIMIKPTKDEFTDEKNVDNFKCWLYKMIEGKPTLQREISLKEILGDEDE